MSLLPLVLSTKQATWRMDDPHSDDSDAEFRSARKKALERDDKTCRFCGFKAASWLEVHHLDDDHHNNDVANLITACPYCHMCQHIGLSGIRGEAVLAYVPEIPQHQLHHLVRCCQVAKHWSDRQRQVGKGKDGGGTKEMADAADAILGKLRAREAEAERLLGTADPKVLADAFLALDDAAYEQRGRALSGIRLLPLGVRKQGAEDIMEKMLDAWMETGGPYANLRPTSWFGMMRSALGA